MRLNPHPPLDKLKSVFEEFHEIEAVYLFGSAATGAVHEESDIDLAVYPDKESLRQKKVDILHQLAKEGFCNVDLVFMNEKDIVLQYEAVRLNKIVYQRPEFDSGSFFSLIVRKYLDFLPYLQIQREAYKKRILNGST
jgi:predicted nucleotidyltransferase